MTSSLLEVLDERENKAIDTCTTCPTLCRWSCPVAEVEARETSSPHRLTILSGLLKSSEKVTVETVQTLPYHCSHCHACSSACHHDNDVPLVLSLARHRVLSEGAAPAAVSEVCGHFGVAGNPQGVSLDGPIERIAEAAGTAVKRSVDVLYLPGCETIATAPDAAVGFLRATSLLGLSEIGVTRASGSCCGLPLLWAGELDGFKGHAARFASQLEEAEKIVVHDPACAHAIASRYADVGVEVRAKVEHVSTYLHAHTGEGVRAHDWPRTAYADTCSLTRGLGEVDAPRKLLRQILGGKADELVDITQPMDADCCGAAGLLPLAAPHTARAMAEARIQAFRETNAERLAMASPRCAAHLKSVDPSLDVVDLTSLFARL